MEQQNTTVPHQLPLQPQIKHVKHLTIKQVDDNGDFIEKTVRYKRPTAFEINHIGYLHGSKTVNLQKLYVEGGDNLDEVRITLGKLEMEILENIFALVIHERNGQDYLMTKEEINEYLLDEEHSYLTSVATQFLNQEFNQKKYFG